MDVWLAFAYILNGEVKNIGSFLYTGYTAANECARVFCQSDDAFAVDVTHIPVWMGDTYRDGVFYRNVEGEEVRIDPLPSVEQQTAQNTNTINSHDKSIDDIWVALLEG